MEERRERVRVAEKRLKDVRNQLALLRIDEHLAMTELALLRGDDAPVVADRTTRVLEAVASLGEGRTRDIIAMVRTTEPEVSDAQVRGTLNHLRQRGRVVSSRHGHWQAI